MSVFSGHVITMFPWGLGMLLLCGVLLLKGQQRHAIRISLWLILFMLGAGYYQQFSFKPEPSNISRIAPLAYVQVEGVRLPATPRRGRILLDVHRVNGMPVSGKVEAALDSSVFLPVGGRVMLEGDLRELETAHFPGDFNEKRFLQAQHVAATLSHIRGVMVLQPEPVTLSGRFFSRLETLRSRIATVFQAGLGSPNGEVLGSIVLGDQAIPVDQAIRYQFIHTGLIHLLAASGMNVGIIAAFILLLTEKLRLPRTGRFLLAMGAVAIYALLTGLPPSIQRAGTMLELALFLKLWDKSLSPLTLLVVSVAVILLIQPDTVMSLGFQFSVLTTFGILAMLPPLQAWLAPYITHWLCGLLMVPLAAQLWILPLSLYHFNQFPLHSVPLNIVVLPLVSVLTVLGFSAGSLGLLYEPLGRFLCWLAWPFIKALLVLAAWGDSLSWAQWQVASPPPWFVLALYGVLFVFLGTISFHGPLRKASLKYRATVLLAAMFIPLFGLSVEHFQAFTQTRIDVIPLSHQHVALIVRPAGQAPPSVLIPAAANYREARTVAYYLKQLNIKTLDTLFIRQSSDGLTAENGVAPIIRDRKIHRVVWAPATLSAESPIFRFQSAGLCMMGTISISPVSDCLVQLTQPPGKSARLWIQPLNTSLEMGRFYQIRVNPQQQFLEIF